MGFSWSLAFRQIKRSEKMAQNKKLISIIIIILYLILLFPYIIASNAGESGIVIENKAMDADSLPNDVQDLLVYKKDTYNVILIEDPATDVSKLEGKRAKERKVILSKETPENGIPSERRSRRRTPFLRTTSPSGSRFSASACWTTPGKRTTSE